jgi:hypothetical protein
MSGSLQGLQNDDLAAAVEYSLVQISVFLTLSVHLHGC